MAMSSNEAYYENEKQLKEIKGKKKAYNFFNRHSRDKVQERLDFKLYDFQALQIDKGWNNLFVSIISIQTGKTIGKSGKASVQNGQCQWEDCMLSTICNSDDSLEDNEGCLLKFVVAMGSARFGTLGEATINLASYIRPETYTASLPLKNCCHGTILQVKIQCLTTIRKYRDKHGKDANSYLEEMIVGYDDMDYTSNVSDNTFNRTRGSSHSDHLDKTHNRKLISKRMSPMATCSDNDFDSLESSFSFWIEKFPHQSSVKGLKNNMSERGDSTYSKDGPNTPYATSRSTQSSSTSAASSLGTQLQDKMEDFEKVSHASDASLTRSVSSSKDLLSAAQVTIELLHGEAKMWEENSRKLMIDVERLQKDLSNKAKNKKDLEMELSASRKENDVLKQEIGNLTTVVKENDSKNLKFQKEEKDNIIEELKDEIKYKTGLNNDLEMKLKKTQESYIDLVFILRRLENTIEKQKEEIADLSMTSSQIQDVEDSEEEEFSLSQEVQPEKMTKEYSHSDVNLCTNEYAIRCLHEGMELMQEKQTNMESTIRFLEKTLVEKDEEMQAARHFMAQTSEDNEARWRNRLFEKETQIVDLEKKLSDGIHAFSTEIIALTQRVQDLEAELCEKHGESRNDVIMSGSFSSNFPLFGSDTAINITQVFLDLYKQLQLSVENLKGQDSLPCQTKFINKSELSKDGGEIDLKELTEAILCTIILMKKLVETKATGFEYEINSHNELIMQRIRYDNEETDCSLKENIFCISGQDLINLHAQLVSELKCLINNQQVESEATNKLEPETQVACLQSKGASNCSTDSQILVSKDDGKSLSELESSDDEQDALFGLEAENVKLSERILWLEAEMKHLNEEKESTSLVLENSETVLINLQAEIRRFELETENIQKKWLEAQEECSFLKVDNLKLQSTNEKLIDESETLETANGDLRMQNLELHNQCAVLESKLGESQIAFLDMLKQVEDLEHKFTSMLEEVALKEKTINADLDVLVQESKKQNERLASNTVLLVYDFCADKAMLQAAFQEEQEKVKLYEALVDNLQAEYEVKVQNYTQELAATRANHETLMVNHEKVIVLLENVKSNEEKLKSAVTRLEVELKTSKLERLQATEEISILEVQLQKTEMLQDEVLVLKRSLNEAELEYRRLEVSYQMLSLEHEELKAEKLSYVQKISIIEKLTSELEECKLSKVELEEKIVRLEWDLTTKEASCRNNVQLRYELGQMRRANGELHGKKDSLQEENEEYQKRVEALEEKLKQEEEVKYDQHNAKVSSTSATAQDDLKLLQKEDNCSCIRSSERPSLLSHPSTGTHNMLQTADQHPKSWCNCCLH